MSTVPDSTPILEEINQNVNINGAEDYTSWWPTENIYSPGLEKSDWLKLLHNTEVFTINSLVVMKCFHDYGGTASCTELSNKYGRDPAFYNIVSSTLAKRVHKVAGCTVMTRSDNSNRWWAILYQGKEADQKQAGVFLWKLRKELKEALDDFDLSSVPLYAPKESMEDVKPKIKEVIDLYKADFERIDSEERYKWIAVKHFQDNWVIDAPDFADMLGRAFAKHFNP